MFSVNIFGDGAFVVRTKGFHPFYDVKSPSGNIIQGVYYQGKDHLILIAKSYFPGGTLDLWRANFEASRPELGECACARLCLSPMLFLSRFVEIQEEHTIADAQVIVLKGPMGLTTVFVRGMTRLLGYPGRL